MIKSILENPNLYLYVLMGMSLAVGLIWLIRIKKGVGDDSRNREFFMISLVTTILCFYGTLN